MLANQCWLNAGTPRANICPMCRICREINIFNYLFNLLHGYIIFYWTFESLSNVSRRGCAYMVLQTIRMSGVYSCAYIVMSRPTINNT